MSHPLLYAVVCCSRNRLRRMLGRLRQPRYLLGTLLAGLYIWFFMIRPYSADGPGSMFDGADPQRVAGLMRTVAGLSLLAMALMSSFSLREGVAFHEHELRFLLGEPITRRGLLTYALLSTQPFLLISVLVFGYMLQRMPGGSAWGMLGVWLVFNLLLALRIGWALLVGRLRPRGLQQLLRVPGVLVLLLLVWAGWSVYRPMRVEVKVGLEPGGETVRQVDREALSSYLADRAATAPMSVVLAPARGLATVLLPRSAGEFALGATVIGGLLALVWTLVLRSRVPFVEASLVMSAQIHALRTQGVQGWRRMQKRSTSKGPPKEPFRLRAVGAPWVAICWKNLISAGPRYRVRTFVIALSLAAVAGLTLAGWPGVDWSVKAVAGGIALYGALLLCLILPSTLRNDLRRDIPHFDVLRPAPISGVQLLIGEVMGTALITGAIGTLGWTFAVAAVDQMGDQVLPPMMRLVVWCTGLMMVWGMALTSATIENGIALTYPGWVQLGAAPQGGLGQMGQNMLSFLVRFILLWLMLIAPAVIGGGVAIVGVVLLSRAPALFLAGVALLATTMGTVVLAAEVAIAVHILGNSVYPKFDLARELR